MINLEEYEKYLQINYSNENTRRQYFLAAFRFIAMFDDWNRRDTLTQDMLDLYAIYLNSLRNPNPLHHGFIKSFLRCFDPDSRLKLIIPKDKSRGKTKIENIDYLTAPDIIEIISEIKDPQLKLMVTIYTETGLRCTELTNVDLTNSDWDIDLTTRRIRGWGKGNKEFLVHFSPSTADKIFDWLEICPNKNRPFAFIKNDGTPYKNQGYEVWRRLIRATKHIGYTKGTLHPHDLRHYLGHFLREEKGWDLEQVRKKLRHSSVVTTQRYSTATHEEIEEKEDKEIFK